MNIEEIKQKDKEDKAIKFYTNYIQAQEKELDWMYRQDEEYYRDEIEQKELLIKGFKTILNLIKKQSKEIEELKNADLTTVYLNGVYDGEKKVKDKIKAKIEEIDNVLKNNYLIDKLKNYFKVQKEVLQSLLEKE